MKLKYLKSLEDNRINFSPDGKVGSVIAVEPSVRFIASIMKKHGSDAIMSLNKVGFNFSNLDANSLKYIIDENGVESISILKDAGADLNKLEVIKSVHLSLDKLISLSKVVDESIYSGKISGAVISSDKTALDSIATSILKDAGAVISSHNIALDSIATSILKDAGADLNKLEVIKSVHLSLDKLMSLSKVVDESIYSGKISGAVISSDKIALDSIATVEYSLNKEEVASDSYIAEQKIGIIGEALDHNMDMNHAKF